MYDIANNTDAIANNTADIMYNMNDIADNAGAIANNTNDIMYNMQDIADNAQAIVNNTADIMDNKEDIADNAGGVEENAENIAILMNATLPPPEETTSWTTVTPVETETTSPDVTSTVVVGLLILIHIMFLL